MSLETWKAEFYPVEAKECPVEQAIEHSLTKWRGLRADAMLRHGVRHEPQYTRIESGEVRLNVNDRTCALCRHFVGDGCRDCPLAAARDGHPCDMRAPDEDCSPFVEWRDNDDPEPMIAALEKALADKSTGEQA